MVRRNVTVDYPHSEDEQDQSSGSNKEIIEEDVKSNTGEELKSQNRVKLLEEEQRHVTKKTGNGLLEINQAKNIPAVSVTSTKKATVDDNEPGKKLTIDERVKDIRAIQELKVKQKLKQDDEEEKRLSKVPPVIPKVRYKLNGSHMSKRPKKHTSKRTRKR
jgi:hypothetical protein